MRTERHVSFLLIALAAAAVIIGAFTLRDGASKTNAATLGSASFTVTAPGAAQALSTPFDITTNLATFVPGTSQPTWGGYDLDLAYSGTLLQINSVTRGLCTSSTSWANPSNTPDVITGCFLQSNITTGVLETINVTCIADGIANLDYVAPDPANSIIGTHLFDEGSNDIPSTLTGTTVTCGAGGPTNTPTNTATATDTPVPPTATNTATPTVTNTPCSGPCPTDTPTSTATATNTATNTAVPTNTATPGGNVRSATPTPGGATSTASATTAAGTPVPGGTTAPAATATKPGGGAGAGITGPNTGDGGSNGIGGPLSGLWLILGGLGLGALGGGMYLRQRARRAR